MILFFDISKLERLAGSNDVKFMEIISNYYYKRSIYTGTKFDIRGTNFILNLPDLLSKDKTVDIVYKVQYVKLAARRDYTQYKLLKYKKLDLSYYPDIMINNIINNPLLDIHKNQISFKFE